MKKLFILIMLITTTIACSDYEFEAPKSVTDISDAKILTRSSEEMPNFDPLSELDGIPLNVINVGNKTNSYLSVFPKGKDLTLFTHDDGSLRQRWYVKKYGGPNYSPTYAVILAGGNNLWTPNKNLTIVPYAPKNGESKAYLAPTTKPGVVYSGALINVPGTPYYWWSYGMDSGIIGATPYYFSSKDGNGVNVSYLHNNNTEFAQWTFQPVGDFEVVEMKYYYLDGDKLTRADQTVKSVEIGGDNDLNYTYSLTGTYEVRSNSSKTSGVSFGISSSVKVGAPIVSAETTITTSTQKSWTLGKSETVTETVEHSVQMKIPVGKRYRFVTIAISYDLDINFVATLRKATDGKTFRVKGRWDGLVADELIVNVYDVSSNNLVRTFTEDEFL